MENFNLSNGGEDIDIETNNEKEFNFSAKCINKKISTLACNNPNCTQYAFVCEDKQCECRKIHKRCLLTDIQQIIQLIEDKRSESKEVINKVSDVLENWIDEISKTRQKIQIMLKNWGLSPAQRAFNNLLKKKDYKKLTGTHVNQITTKTVEYFTEETKQRLLSQIETMSKNYDTQIKSIMKTVTSLFDNYSIDDNQAMFNDINEIQIKPEQNLIEKVQRMLKQLKQPQQKKDYDQFVIFFKQTLKEDFANHMQKYKQSRRVYGTKKLRQKYFDDYFTALNKGEQYIKKWQQNLKQQLTVLSKSSEKKFSEFAQFYRESDCIIEKPFLPQTALSLQKTINTIYLLVDFIKTNGKGLIQWLFEKNKRLFEKFELIMFLLDALMDQHPQIDEIEHIWNIIRFEDKLKNEVNYLYQTIEQTLKDPYELEIKSIKNHQ